MLKGLKILTLIVNIIVFNQSFAQLNVPNSKIYTHSAYKIFLQDTVQKFVQTHLSLKPFNERTTVPDHIYLDKGQYYYWITQKLFKEHFLVFKGEDFWCAVDPVIDLEMGKNISNFSEKYLFWNTRGIRVQAKFFKNFGFETSIYETQARLLQYQSIYIDEHGEFLSTNNGYKQDNAIVPGYARTKPFGTNGYDFAFAQGYFSYQPTNWLNIQAGNGNHFIGHGHRSLLLSDFTVNYPYFKPEVMLLNNRLQYAIIYASQQNLYRLPFHLTPEANYEKKMGVSHYLEYSISKKLQIGIFENNTWVTTDSTGTLPFNYLSLNPVIGNSLFKGGNTPNRYNSIFGLNLSFHYKSTLYYGQLLFDNHKIDGLQVGISTYDALISNLHLQVEYNQVGPQAYLANNKRSNYHHSNLPLAHPLGNHFQEILGIVNYEYERFFMSYSSVYSMRNPTDSLSQHATLLYVIDENFQYPAINIWHNTVEMGYRFNRKYNLELYIGYINRISSVQNTANQTNYTYFGLRTNLRNKTLDW